MAKSTPQRDAGGPQPWARVLLVAGVLVGLAAAVVAVARFTPITNRYFSDADSIREPAVSARPRDILWQPAKSLSDLINTTTDDYEPRLSADGLTLFFVRGKAGSNSDIYFSNKTPTGWTEPAAVDGVNSEHDDLGPEPSSDGTSLYFYSDRPGGTGGYDLWVSYRGAASWQPPVNLGASVNSEFNDYGPALTPDGKSLYFASNRPQANDANEQDPSAWRATIREDLFQRDYDLYRSAITERGIGNAAALDALNTPYNEGAPAVSSFGDFLYFASDRPGGEGGFDLYRAWRLRGDHQPVENLGPSVNTKANELDPGLSLGGYALYFSSDRVTMAPNPPSPKATTGVAANREYNLYYTTSREVFSEIERLERPPIDWAALWSQIGPNLLWALLFLLLLLLLWALLRDARGRRLSLLAKCLLASATAHLLMLLLMNVWAVTATIAKEFNRRGRIQIALASPTAGSDLFNQIRGKLTSIEAPTPPTVASPRQVTVAEVPVEQAAANLDVARQAIEIVERPRVEATVADAAVPQRIERHEVDPSLTADLTPVAVPAMLPKEAAPIGAVEAPPPARPMVADTTPRPHVADEVPRETPPTMELQPAATSEQLAAMTGRASSMAEPTPTHDAALTARAISAESSLAETVAADLPPQTKLELTVAPVERVPEASEVAPTITVQASAATRKKLATEIDIAPAARVPQPITADTEPIRLADASFAATPTLTESEGSPAPTTTPDHRSGATATDTNLPTLGEFSLPTPYDTGAARVVETPPGVPPSVTGDSRWTFDRNIEPEFTAPVAVAVEPSATGLGEATSTLAAPPIAVDVAPAPNGPAKLRASRSDAETVMPGKVEFTLPTLEQSSAPGTTETSPRVASHPTEPRRAALPLEGALADASTNRAFIVPDSADKTEGREGPRTLADINLYERAADRSKPSFGGLLPGTEPSAVPPSLSLDLGLPTETQPPEDPYAQRFVENRIGLVERLGGSAKTEQAVADALTWLARHQSADGHWDGALFDDGCGRCGGQTDVVADRALTGLSLLAFLGAGHTPAVEGPYRDHTSRALRWLLDRQDADGDLRGEETMYTHGIVSIALSESYGITRDPGLADPVKRAVGFIERARNTDEGGWRYDPGQPGDTSVLGWQVMALKSAHLSGIPVSAEAFHAARQWLEKVSRPSRPGLYAYMPDRSPTPSMTAEGMFVQQLLGRRREDPIMEASAAYVLKHLPDWSAEPNTYYWYYATLALFQHGGAQGRAWNAALVPQLLDHQRKEEGAKGSWDPVGEWAEVGGRVYQTALCTLMLEVYYRYLPLYTVELATDAIGSITGRVTDATTGTPLAGAAVRLNLPNRDDVTVTTDEAGRYTLSVPEVPDFFALSASREGFVPHSRNVDAAMLHGAPLSLDFRLSPVSEAVVAIEPVPEVHHLGDNNFDGTINSQFQKESEGAEFSATFDLKETQLPPRFTHGEIHLLAKGVQRRHRIVINGVDIERRLDDSPEDGSFGEFAAPFDPEILRAGVNKIEIIARPSTSDIDDFEFVNVQILLAP